MGPFSQTCDLKGPQATFGRAHQISTTPPNPKQEETHLLAHKVMLKATKRGNLENSFGNPFRKPLWNLRNRRRGPGAVGHAQVRVLGQERLDHHLTGTAGTAGHGQIYFSSKDHGGFLFGLVGVGENFASCLLPSFQITHVPALSACFIANPKRNPPSFGGPQCLKKGTL